MADFPIDTCGQRLRWARLCAGLSAADLAELSYISASTISRIENSAVKDGGPNTAATTIALLARALGISMGWLWYGEGTEPDPVQIRNYVKRTTK